MKITLTNATSKNIAIDFEYTPRRAVREKLAPGAVLDVTRSASLEDLAADSKLQAQITAGHLTLAVSDAPITALRLVKTAGAGGSADDSLVATLEYAVRVHEIVTDINTAVGGSTVQLFTAVSGGGTAVTASQSAASAAVLVGGPAAGPGALTLTKGTTVYLRRSDNGIACAISLKVERIG